MQPSQIGIPAESISQPQMAAAFKNLQHAVAQCSDAVFFMDPAGLITRINPAFEDLTGYDPLAVVGRDLSFIVAGGGQSTDYRSLWKSLFAEHSFEGDLQVQTKAGRIRSLHVRITAVRDRGGQLTSLVGNAKGLEVRHAELQISEVVHDLNNLLMVIATHAELMTSAGDRADWRRHLHEIQAACSRAIARVGNIALSDSQQMKAKSHAAAG